MDTRSEPITIMHFLPTNVTTKVNIVYKDLSDTSFHIRVFLPRLYQPDSAY